MCQVKHRIKETLKNFVFFLRLPSCPVDDTSFPQRPSRALAQLHRHRRPAPRVRTLCAVPVENSRCPATATSQPPCASTPSATSPGTRIWRIRWCRCRYQGVCDEPAAVRGAHGWCLLVLLLAGTWSCATCRHSDAVTTSPVSSGRTALWRSQSHLFSTCILYPYLLSWSITHPGGCQVHAHGCRGLWALHWRLLRQVLTGQQRQVRRFVSYHRLHPMAFSTHVLWTVCWTADIAV